MGGEAWVSVECTFQCRSCAFRVPINGVTDVATCAHCGIEQALDVQQWRQLLDEAHAAADDFTEGKGEHRGLQASGDNELHAKAKAGHPPCSVCQAPLTVTVDAARATATCTCGATATYELPAAARQVSAARAVLSSEHRSDREHVRVEGGAAIAITCPQCAAPLPVDQATKFVTCAFCKTQSRIPDRAWFRIASAVPEPEPMWLLFEGPSTKHERQERDRRQAKLADAKRKAAAREAEHAREDADERARERQEADGRKRAAEKSEQDAKEKKKLRVALLLFVAIVAGTAIMIFSIKKTTERPPPATKAATPQAKKDYDAMIRGYEASCSRAIYPPTGSIAGTPQGSAYQACVDAAKLAASPDVPIDIRLAHVARACREGACTEYQVVSIGTMDAERSALIAPWKTLCTSGMTEACAFLSNACKAGGVREACVSPSSPSASPAPSAKHAPR